jgi:hypothetical protein
LALGLLSFSEILQLPRCSRLGSLGLALHPFTTLFSLIVLIPSTSSSRFSHLLLDLIVKSAGPITILLYLFSLFPTLYLSTIAPCQISNDPKAVDIETLYVDHKGLWVDA